MIRNSTRKVQALALLTGGVFAMGAMLQPTAAHADSKSKLYKGGAAALGVLGAYWILEGKTVEGAAAAAGGYYAYKKGRDIDDKNDRWDDYRWDDRYRDRDRYRYDDHRYDNDRYRRDRYDRNDYRYDYRDRNHHRR